MFINAEASLSAVARDLRKTRSDAVVIGVAQGADGPVLLDNPLSAKNAEAVQGTLAMLGATGAPDQLLRLPGVPELNTQVIALVGVGKVDGGDAPSHEQLRRAAGSAVRQLAGLRTVILAFPAPTSGDVSAVAEGATLGAYSYTEHRARSAEASKANVERVVVLTPLAGSTAVEAALTRAAVVGQAVNTTRTLVNMPPSQLFPASFADAAKELAKSTSVKITVWDEKRLEKDGFGGILAVGQGSSRLPRLVKVEYTPSQSSKAPSVHLVGKGITFDTGGISIKPAAKMDEMKSDMAGAASVLSTVLAAARLGLKAKVTGWLCIAENMPSGSAQRPSDVIVTRGGTSVEVLNTDAEGRLVMADGLAAASEENPDVVIDIATLTGAAIIALGTRTAGLMGDSTVTDGLKAAADDEGEAAWAMPLPDELRAGLDSPVADIANVGDKPGGMLTAGIFLREFVGARPDGSPIPWAHIDIAGPSYNTGSAYGHTPKLGTGAMVRTLVRYLESVGAEAN
ncbi:leucyl aminopeptidase [Sinomonas sp. G460-2]|uniref:leucyl aminopeptidase n=1 Tax=Sinomonas sp. G460-2 TaxID=3393464 RepID=UPI0039EE51FB